MRSGAEFDRSNESPSKVDDWATRLPSTNNARRLLARCTARCRQPGGSSWSWVAFFPASNEQTWPEGSVPLNSRPLKTAIDHARRYFTFGVVSTRPTEFQRL